MSDADRKRKLGYISMGVIAAVLVIFMTASLLGRLPPPGADIVDLTPPDDHETTECYRCHRGMSSGSDVTGKELPVPHPQHQCGECHEGFVEDPSYAQPE